MLAGEHSLFVALRKMLESDGAALAVKCGRGKTSGEWAGPGGTPRFLRPMRHLRALFFAVSAYF